MGGAVKPKGEEPSCGGAELVVFVGALVAGTGCSLFSKVLLSMRAVGREGEVESFRNPLFQTWGMFLGMLFSLPMHVVNEASKRRKKTRKGGYSSIADELESAATKNGGEEKVVETPTATYFLLAIPSIFDLAATALAMFGLTYITVSVYQMLRGAAIVFVAILKHFLIGDRLAPFMWLGVFLNVVSIVMVGLTAAASEDESASNDGKSPLIGVGLILCGAVVQSLQYAFEEKVMSADVGAAPPLLVIAMEGFWGLVVCTAVLYPLCYAAGVEDPRDTWAMLSNSRDIQITFFFYFVSVFSYNVLAIVVTFMLNSVWHAILDNFRPITVWVTDLVIFYVFSSGNFGEPWAFPGSYIQLGALAVLLFGTAVYNGSVRLPYFAYPDDDLAYPPAQFRASFRESPLLIRASPLTASNALTRSPLVHGLGPGRQHTHLLSGGGRPLPTVDEGASARKLGGMRGRSSSFTS
mmetsp:Transcript_25629/g.78835  ORF Transcript_25629/g.78835 Transcript_25629/m.78835 type:complete len:466 (+) Transcript_25629:107-1504(+)